jgi:hypothetical protein
MSRSRKEIIQATKQIRIEEVCCEDISKVLHDHKFWDEWIMLMCVCVCGGREGGRERERERESGGGEAHM